MSVGRFVPRVGGILSADIAVPEYESDRYTENANGSGSGLMKFSVWNESDSCKGAAY